jgi:type II secretory pathway predicted ATPase ExeA
MLCRSIVPARRAASYHRPRTAAAMPTTVPTLRQLAERDERVFPSYPQVARYFPGSSIEDARHRLGRAIERGNGPGLVVGGPGTGKSLLLQVLASQFHEQFDVVLPACARLCTRRALLQSILFELGLPYRSRDEGELRLSLLDHLLSKEECPSGLLLLVDEAHTLPPQLLDELRVLTNLVRGARPRVRLILAGSSSLEESFTDPELESFSQRLTARCYLGAFNREETIQFIRAQLAASRVSPDDVFTADACSAVFEATDGVPRLINQLCDRALVDANAAGRSKIDRQVIQATWADIQQLPTPWDTPEQSTLTTASRVIEFGNLTSEDRSFDSNSDATTPARLAEFDTELDVIDEEVDEVVFGQATAAATPKPSEARQLAADPFAEKFDEEEVVLDSFAAWDDMFRRDMPRVANRRDPGFATLVEAAMQSTAKSDFVPNYEAADLSFAFDLQNILDVVEEVDTAPKEVSQEADLTWPPLRIADVSDSHATIPGRVHSIVDDPVLIIEDDAPAPAPQKPPVRREEYRNLFSRLRSG